MRLRIGAVAWLLLAALPASADLSVSPPPRSADDYSAMISSKILCSAVFVSGRDLDEALAHSIDRQSRDVLKSATVTVDRDLPGVVVAFARFRATSRFYGDHGCVNLTPGYDDVFFRPQKIATALPDAAQQRWPNGDATAVAPAHPAALRRAAERAAALVFAEPDAHTAAFLVVHRGAIVAERYGAGFDRHSQLESWSMGKSLTAALVGVLIQQGHFALDDPAPVPLWRESGDDPRRAIRVADLLQMSSGLHCSFRTDPPHMRTQVLPDHSHIYAAAVDVFDFAIRRPLEHAPGTVGRYRNCDPLALGYIVRRTVEDLGRDYLGWPQQALFDRIGIRRQVLEPDPHGNLLLTGYDYGTARNWARLALLFAQDGVWDGERILPAGFADFVASPAPGWEPQNYGGLFWLVNEGPDAERLTDRWNLPKDTYYMAGAGLQRVFIVPSLELIVVRLGHRSGAAAGADALNEALRQLARALRP